MIATSAITAGALATWRLRMTDKIEGEHFFVRRNGLLFATPLLLVLIMVELSDVIFAVDSIPAIFAVTTDPFIVLTSNLLPSSACALCTSCWRMWQSVFNAEVWPVVDSGFIGVKMLIVDFTISQLPYRLASSGYSGADAVN